MDRISVFDTLVETMGKTSSITLNRVGRLAFFAFMTSSWITRRCLSVRPISRLAVYLIRQ